MLVREYEQSSKTKEYKKIESFDYMDLRDNVT
eukprot:UN06471